MTNHVVEAEALLTPAEVAALFRVDPKTVTRWARAGKLTSLRTLGGHRRYRRRDLEAFLERSGPGGKSSGPLVLVVDDDARLREFMRVNLEMEGYTVREASSAEEALGSIEDQAPELVLLDVVMPGVDGWEMLQRMQERYGSIPVIMFSGQVDANSAGDAEQRGARGFVGKPFDPQQLIERAKQLVPA